MRVLPSLPPPGHNKSSGMSGDNYELIQDVRQNTVNRTSIDNEYELVSKNMTEEGNTRYSTSATVHAKNARNSPENRASTSDKFDHEYAETIDRPSFRHTRIDSPLNDKDGYFVPSADKILENEAFNNTKVIYEEVENLQPTTSKVLNIESSPASSNSSTQLEHAYFAPIDLQSGKDTTDVKNFLDNLTPSMDKPDNEYAVTIDPAVFRSDTYFESTVCEEHLTNVAAAVDTNTCSATTHDSKVIYEEVEDFQPTTFKDLNTESSPTSSHSSTHLEHAYLDRFELQSETKTCSHNEYNDESIAKEKVYHGIEDTLIHATEVDYVNSQNDESQDKCELNLDECGYLVLE